MWKKIVVAVAVVMLLAGIGFLLYPTVSNEIGKARANGEIEAFEKRGAQAVDSYAPSDADEPVKTRDEALEKGYIDDEGYPIDKNGSRTAGEPVVFTFDLDRLHADSRAYNRSILHHQGTVDTNDFSAAALQMSRYGLSNFYAFVSAPAIGMRLPVYLGANDAMMSYGAAHLCNTSLPLDETDTNAVIAAHTGYIGRIFFDNIRNLEIGDEVSIANYWENIDYRVIETKTVPPTYTDDTLIQDGRQLLTLVTCITENGVTNRYLVICEAT